jgi:hypothetical protein
MSRRERTRGAAAAEGAPQPAIDAFRARHLSLGARDIESAIGRTTVTVNEAESPLAWLARRKGRNGAVLVSASQLEAGERLRADFTRAQLMPRTTSNWDATVASGRRGARDTAAMTDAIVAARQRVQHALDAAGPEFSGLLVDVCCFLKRLEQVEHERRWPARSAKVVLQLGLDRLARHYGYAREIRGAARAPLRAWQAASSAGE